MTHDDKVLVLAGLKCYRDQIERQQKKQVHGSTVWFAYSEEIKRVDDARARLEKEPSK